METLLPLLTFVVASSVTPGPNNLMVLTSGANWGLLRTMPHIMGIVLGFPVMILGVGIGVSALFEAAPWLHTVLKYVAFVYLCWLAWRIATAARPGESRGIQRPLNLWEAAAFQWVNPKGWALVVSGTAMFVDPAGNKLLQIIGIAALFAIVVLPNGVAWAVFGRGIARFLSNDTRRRWFNIAMAVLLVASTVPALY
jgi:threonine/homoserine/homoserine lactone efflux protein